MTVPDELFRIDVHRGPVPRVVLSGELDLHGVNRFAEALRGLVGEGPELVEIDAGELEFIDSSGLRVLLVVRSEAEAAGTTLQLVAVSKPVHRVMSIGGLEQLLPDA